MYAFFVLGIIPGTNIQITFQDWLRIIAVMVSYVLVSKITLHTYRFFKLTNQLMPVLAPVRSTLHATQLHQRVR